MCHAEVTLHGETEWLHKFTQCLGDRTLIRVHICLSPKTMLCVNECETAFDVMRDKKKKKEVCCPQSDYNLTVKPMLIFIVTLRK